MLGGLCYVAESPVGNRSDMRAAPGRLISYSPSGPEFTKAHGVIERPCQDPDGHPDRHARFCRSPADANLIRPAGTVNHEVPGYAMLKYASGRHEIREAVAWTSRGLCLLSVNDKHRRYEWRSPPEPLALGGFRDRAPVRVGNHHRRIWDFVVQSFTLEDGFYYQDVEGSFVRVPLMSKASNSFIGDRALINEWEHRRRDT